MFLSFLICITALSMFSVIVLLMFVQNLKCVLLGRFGCNWEDVGNVHHVPDVLLKCRNVQVSKIVLKS